LQKAYKETSKIITATINVDITYKHFDEAIAELKIERALSPSIVTVNMIKAWLRSTKIFVYKHKTNIWKSPRFPRTLGIPADTNGFTFISTPLNNTKRQMSTIKKLCMEFIAWYYSMTKINNKAISHYKRKVELGKERVP
jgi:hypothetical protein